MRGWRSKMLVVLVMYFAGFATAIYTIAPSNASAAGSAYVSDEGGGPSSQADQIAVKVKTGMTKFFSFAEEKITHAGNVIKKKMAESD
ncbi:MAG: hypothetical protein KAS23_08750 [Anaerohalosphaera sp.]|nr:hypothetical protein [Anaerohalosphaera sp.]